MSEEIKNILQEKFEDFEPKPTRDLWAGIEAEIQPRRRVAAAWWYAAAAAVAIILSVVFWPDSATKMDANAPIATTTETVVPQEEAPQPTQQTLAQEEDQDTEFRTRNKEQGFLNKEQGIRNPKPKTHTNVDNSSLPKTPVQTKEVKTNIQLAAVATPAPSTISVAEAIPENIDLQTTAVVSEAKTRLSLKDIDLPELDPVSLVSFASAKLDEWGVRSPVHYQQQEQKSQRQTKSRFQLVLGKFSITHTSHKPI